MTRLGRGVLPIFVLLGCTDALVPSPFARPSLTDAGAPAPDAMRPDAGASGISVVPTELLGGPCVDDAQCDDAIDCTFGACDATLGRCRFTADDSRCADAIFCNGVERCDPRLGCRPGPPTSCSDSSPCTIDRCDEETQACVRVDRDVDGDGDVDDNCGSGGDCNDLDPLVSSLVPELCGNLVDDDCDGTTDEADCQTPQFDTCADGLDVSASGAYVLLPAGTRLDYAAPCAPEGALARDLVLLVDVPAGPPQDVDIVAHSALGELSLGHAELCGQAPSDGECLPGAVLPTGERGARLRLHSVAPGLHPVYVFTTASAPIQLDVSFETPTLAAENRTCDGALELQSDQPVNVDLAISGEALPSACATQRGDLFYKISLPEPADVVAFGESLDGLGQVRLSLRQASCAELPAELRCKQAALPSLQARALPAGDYVLAVSASGPTLGRIRVQLRPPSAAPAGDACASAPAVLDNRTETLSFVSFEDDIAAGCSPGAVDLAHRLDLSAPSDVLLIGRFSPQDLGAVALANPRCEADDVLGCRQGLAGSARLAFRDLAAGEYRVVLESALGLPATLTAAIRPAQPPTLVPLAENCDSALLIPPGGGFFQGSTLNAVPDYSASCDFATPAGAPDQLLRLVLDQPRRVILDMRGSDFDTLLNVRRGPSCPGEEVPSACSVTGGSDRSFLDLNLSAGEYFVQIDGYAGGSGTWFLNVFVLDP
jgi:putative metal-binding protein